MRILAARVANHFCRGRNAYPRSRNLSSLTKKGASFSCPLVLFFNSATHTNIWRDQSAFVKDRLLIENILLATEMVKDYHKESVSPRCALKIDISKAFDSVQWLFLTNTLKALNFPDRFIHWINLCITTASFSVQVNGELAGFFRSTRGLRQGCSLSPYLFVICMDVLSKLLDKAARMKKIDYHPHCKNLGLTHLSFADDLMVFSDGKMKSVEGVVAVFEDFAKMSGLKISMEKSTMFLAGFNTNSRQEMLDRFPFAQGQLPVRYLGLPLVTKCFTKSDYLPLLEKIRKKFTSWTTRPLTFAGRLQLIKAVIVGLTNFWLSAFRLPKGCIREIEKLCSAFLWSGPSLNSRKAKVSWEMVCKPKKEGGLDLKALSDVNKVCCLKLVWRIASSQPSLWVNWIKKNLIRQGSFWAIKENTNSGSWIWRKLLKYRDLAYQFCKVDVKNGRKTDFWFDKWSDMGRLIDIAGPRGTIDMGIPLHSTLASAIAGRRRRHHRTDHLKKIEEEIEKLSINIDVETEDSVLWKKKDDKFRRKFCTKDTWKLIRSDVGCTVNWWKGVWFKHATPKSSFLMWLAIQNRLSTMDRMQSWDPGICSTCVLCQATTETRSHLFFTCKFSLEIWNTLTKGLLCSSFTAEWDSLISIISNGDQDKTKSFHIRYSLQTSVYFIWRERNNRRHGEDATPASCIAAQIDKQVRNRLLSIRASGDYTYEDGLQKWFATRT